MEQQETKKQALQAAYLKKVERITPNSPILFNCIRAFFTGGMICVVGQGVSTFGSSILGYSGDLLSGFVAVVMVFLGATLTGFGVYDKIGAFGGAGSAVPITGFANGIVSSAMEYRREGLVMGIGAKMFTIAGPVLVYGVIASTLVGVVYLLLN